MTSLFWPFVLASLLIELTPGPNMAWLALTSATEGRRSGLSAVGGIALGLAVLGLATALGLAQLASASPIVFELLRYAGSAYLLWLAWEAWRGGGDRGRGAGVRGDLAWFRHGLAINLLNPKAALFFMTILPGFIMAGRAVGPQTLVLSAAYVAVATAVHLLIVIFAGSAHGWLADGQRTAVVRRVFAAMLVATAVWSFVALGR
jgi:threonine/homoserine/homoserine lactone efflux protein